MSVISAPDYCEPIIGWRAWRAVERRGELYLMSLFHRVRWPWLEPLAGICSAPRLPWFRRRKRHAAPAERCQCGIYASSLETAAEYVTQPIVRGAWPIETMWPVIGEVALWGQVVECTDGWRAARAYPQRLFALAEGTSQAARLREGLERYGVPVEVIETAAEDDAEVVAFVQPIVAGPAGAGASSIDSALP